MGICPVVGDNPGKPGLIPHTPLGLVTKGESGGPSGLALLDEPKSDQLVGGVTAYQGNDP